MTIARGLRVLAAPCCGAQYAFPRYLSMNFSAFEYWTDGWRDGSPTPNDEGLRRCTCGTFVLIQEMVEVAAHVESSELPPLRHVPEELLPECIAKSPVEQVKVAARQRYWRHLNHAYREAYRLHRTAEEATTKAEWEPAPIRYRM